VANSGVIVSRVTQTKQKEKTTYVGIDANMNTLLRPALYNARHHISALDPTATLTCATVVGDVCESADVFGIDFAVPTKEGELVVVENCGAYARSMAMTYNMRPPGEEYFIKDGEESPLSTIRNE
jgi:diaminopimelate decarboxylase/aspartate kinase